MMDKVAVIESLQAEIRKEIIAGEMHGGAQLVEIEIEQFGRDALIGDRLFDVFFEVLPVRFGKRGIRCGEAHCFSVENIEEKARGDLRVGGLFLDL